MTPLRVLPAVLLALAVTGCGGGTPSSSTAPPADASEGLKELGEWYKYRATTEKAPPPAKADELAEHEAVMPNAFRLIQEGGLVVVWRVGYSPNSTEVLAYEKGAPTGGGKVLLRNGTVKEMTADQFRAAKR